MPVFSCLQVCSRDVGTFDTCHYVFDSNLCLSCLLVADQAGCGGCAGVPQCCMDMSTCVVECVFVSVPVVSLGCRPRRTRRRWRLQQRRLLPAAMLHWKLNRPCWSRKGGPVILGGVCRWMGGRSALHVRAPVCRLVPAGVPLRASNLCMLPVQAVAGSEHCRIAPAQIDICWPCSYCGCAGVCIACCRSKLSAAVSAATAPAQAEREQLQQQHDALQVCWVGKSSVIWGFD